MNRFEVAHIKEQGVDLIIIPVGDSAIPSGTNRTWSKTRSGTRSSSAPARLVSRERSFPSGTPAAVARVSWRRRTTRSLPVLASPT